MLIVIACYAGYRGQSTNTPPCDPKFEDLFSFHKAYMISNVTIGKPNPAYKPIHPAVEIMLERHRIVREIQEKLVPVDIQVEFTNIGVSSSDHHNNKMRIGKK